MRKNEKQTNKRTAIRAARVSQLDRQAAQETDYCTYRLSIPEAILGWLFGAVVGFVVVYLIFRSARLAAVLSVPAGIAGIRRMRGSLLEKRKGRLLREFRDMLDSLDGAFSAGAVYRDAFSICQKQLARAYGKDSLLAKELEIVLRKYDNGYSLPQLLIDLAERTGLEDMKSFADVFRVTLNMGGNMREAVAYSRSAILEKIDAEQGIRAGIAAAKQELRIMMVLPLVVTLVMTGTTGGESASAGAMFIIRCIAFGLYLGAGVLGKKMMRIHV